MISLHKEWDGELPDPDGPGVSHGLLLETISRRANARGWSIGSFDAHLSRSGRDITATTWVVKANSLPEIPGFRYSLGVTSTYTGRRGLRFYGGGWLTREGGTVVFSSIRDPEWTYAYRRGVGLDAVVNEALKRWYVSARGYRDLIGILKRRGMFFSEDSHLMIKSGWETVVSAGSKRVPMMPWSRFHGWTEDYQAGDRTAWGLVTSFGRVAASNPPEYQLDQMYGFSKLVLQKITDGDVLGQETPDLLFEQQNTT